MGIVNFRIVGVHPVRTTEPCYLFEVELFDPNTFEWDSITQEIKGRPASDWQVVWNEQSLSEKRWVFFFHYLDLSKPLLTCLGKFPLPEPTPRPSRLDTVKYESPC